MQTLDDWKYIAEDAGQDHLNPNDDHEILWVIKKQYEIEGMKLEVRTTQHVILGIPDHVNVDGQHDYS